MKTEMLCHIFIVSVFRIPYRQGISQLQLEILQALQMQSLFTHFFSIQFTVLSLKYLKPK